MHNLSKLFAVSTLALLTACSSSPERGGDVGGDPDVTQDTAPGIGGEGDTNGVEVLPADTQGGIEGQDIQQGQDLDEMKMVDVDSIYAPVIYFDYDQYELSDDATTNVRYHADLLLANPQQKVILQGHTDERGTPEYNLALGEKRAKSVEQAMMLFGIQQDRIEVISFGEEQPEMLGSNEEAWAKNRRVEIIIK